MNKNIWIFGLVLLGLSFLIDLSRTWFIFVPTFYSKILLWASALIGGIVLVLIVWEEIAEKRIKN